MGIDHSDVIAQLRRSLGHMEKEEIACPGRGAPSGSVKKMAMASRPSKKITLPDSIENEKMKFEDKNQSEVVNMVLTDMNKMHRREVHDQKTTDHLGDARLYEKVF